MPLEKRSVPAYYLIEKTARPNDYQVFNGYLKVLGILEKAYPLVQGLTRIVNPRQEKYDF